jgi:peptidoglycan/xylan/chitin deacetylase (PgdA/CDA1 family)
MLVRGRADDQQVYLTFDDGPDPVWTPRILDILAESNACATFFVVGKLARAEAALVRRIAAEGHAVGNHTWGHRHPWTLPPAVAQSEVRDGAAAISDILGSRPAFYRPPHGRLRHCMNEEAEAGGQTVVLWSRSAVDWGLLGTARRISARLDKVSAGDIVLMHDGGRGVNKPAELAAVLPSFLDAASRRRLNPSPLREALPVRRVR